MKVDPKELINLVTEAGTEYIEEHSELSEQILIVAKELIWRIKDKLLLLDASDLGIPEDEIKAILFPTKKEKDEQE